MIQKFKAATGPKPVTTQKIAESWSPEERKAAAKLYKETKQEILDPSGTSLESLLAQALSGSDLHHQRFKGSLDTMGMPTREACIKCHSSPANPGVFTPVAQRILKSREDLEKVGYDEEAIRGLLETMHH
ncbi:unnamed protein product [Sphagnum jensenii]|uniref:Cytochrome c domain-containing protein n=1 Tax=Sphagnum jensenii TaxID=128206 RepID=A0ABP0V5K2_9BRYO